MACMAGITGGREVGVAGRKGGREEEGEVEGKGGRKGSRREKGREGGKREGGNKLALHLGGEATQIPEIKP